MPYRVPPKNHQYRIGHVRRSVVRAFLVAGGRDLATAELLRWTHARALHRGVSRLVRRHYCQSVRRAADRVATRVGQRQPGGILWRLKTPTV
jgi:hypothetical protein